MTRPQLPAIEGGDPVRTTMLPYGRHVVEEADIQAVGKVLRGDWLTTGPTIEAFERAIADVTGAANVVAVSSGTAALHAAVVALDLRPGDEVIVPSLTFVATANAVLYCQGRPVFAEVSPATLTVDPHDVRRRVTSRTRAIISVHYAGLGADQRSLDAIAVQHGLRVVEDAAHALGARTDGAPIGSRSDLAVFSFHPVKHITTFEGGAVAARSPLDAERLRRFRNHGISKDLRARERERTWQYEMVELGFNYRLSDVGAAMGLSQLRRIGENLARRRSLARGYRRELAGVDELELQQVDRVDEHAWHIFPVLLRLECLRVDRDAVVRALRADNIGANVHYAPVHLQPYYRRQLGTARGDLPVTEAVSERLITLPLFAGMTDADLLDVVVALKRILRWYAA